MSAPGRGRPRRRASSDVVALLATWLCLQLLVSVVAVVLLQPGGGPPAGPVADGGAVRAAPSAPEPDPRAVREQAVRALLDARAAAVMSRDREAFLAGVRPEDPEFLGRQAALFDNLAEVPLSSWEYQLDPRTDRGPDAELDGRYGTGQWWAPDVVLKYAIADFDPEPTYAPQRLTFVQSGGTWALASDDDFAEAGAASARGLWDAGPVVAFRGERTLALGHPGSEDLLRELAAGVDAAVPRVSAVWGTDWSQTVVVLVPDDQAELEELLGGGIDLTRIAAVATAELTDLEGGYHPVGNRVIVNPPNFAKLGRLGRQVVLTHETAHVATRKATGPDVPTWLVEGLADYIGYLDVPVPLTTAAREVQTAVAEGRIPERLPADADFDGANEDLPLAYESSWLAFRLIVDTYGLEPALRFYRAVGASRDAGSDVALERAFADELGTSTAAFTAAWREHLASTFS
ncbi:MAG TPA: hypothetical protein VM433_01845 [Mycobacteriales bacterium]|nr:hypothetical protein [Mycobacteriales bacterium]